MHRATSTPPAPGAAAGARQAARPLHLVPGRNCWRVPRAERIAVLVDGEAYFAALRRSLIQARRSIAIAAWDLHSRLELVRPDSDGETPDDGLPTALGKLLMALLEQRPELEVYILLWDYASIYALEREPLFFGDAPWGNNGTEHRRLHFIKDGAHPLAASQHQKLVIVDGRIAWSGGFDLSKWRWDTSAHRADEPRRRDPHGDAYPPFHDVQVLVDGEAAGALAALFAERWRRAGGEHPPQPADADTEDPWPAGLEPLLRDHAIAIARTLPAYDGHAQVREVERLYLDMIDGAERFIYAQNQYLTSRSLADALCRALGRDDGPEVALVLPEHTGDWLEKYTMDILRARVLEQLRDADRHGRLRVLYPQVPGLADDACLMVHAKLMIVDDRVLRIGSSNLSNRSMGLDSECDLCVLAERAEDEAVIGDLRRQLMAMLGSGSAQALEETEHRGAEAGRAGLLDAIGLLVEAADPDDGPRLRDLDGGVDPEWSRQLPDERLIDPDRPLDGELVTDAVVGEENTPALRRRVLVSATMIGLLLALAAAWRWTPLGDWLQPQQIADAMRGLSSSPWGMPVGIIALTAASLVAVPVTLLILVSALVFGSVSGAVVALAGATLSGIAGYGIGRAAGRDLVERLAGGRLEGLRGRLSRRGILAVVTLRIVPVAPFAVLNLFAGAIRVPLRDYVIGTVVGMLPGVVAMSVFAEGLLSLLGRADLRSVALLLVGVLSLGGLFWLGRRALRAASD